MALRSVRSHLSEKWVWRGEEDLNWALITKCARVQCEEKICVLGFIRVHAHTPYILFGVVSLSSISCVRTHKTMPKQNTSRVIQHEKNLPFSCHFMITIRLLNCCENFHHGLLRDKDTSLRI